MPGHGLFVGAAAFGAAVILITEGLSLGHLLTPRGLGTSWGLAAALGLWALRGRRSDGPPFARAAPLPVVALGAVGAILAVTGAIALLAPPNTWDSMTYHMSRVAHWSQAGSVANYPTHIMRQLWYGPGAEFLIAHLYVLTGGDRLANLVQWLAFAACVVGAAIVAGELGGGPRARAVGAVACATLPMAIAQASSTQNDLVASFWLLSLGYWTLRFRIAPSLGTAALIGVGAGLAGVTKPHMVFLAVPWLLAFLVIAGARGRRHAVGWVLMAGLIAVALNVGHVGRTARLLWSGESIAQSGVPGRQDRHPPVWSAYMTTTLDPRAVVSNALRSAALQLVTPSERVNNWVTGAILATHRVMGIDASDSRSTVRGGQFRVGPFGLHEDVSGNPLHLLAGFVAGLIIWRRRQAFDVPVRLWAGLSLASAIALVGALSWGPWNARYHLPLFVLLSPLLGVALESRRRLAVACAASFCLLALPSLAMTWPRPVIGSGSVLTMPRTAQQFRSRPKLQPVYEGAADVVSDMRCTRVGLIFGGDDDWEYPFWPLLRTRLGNDLRMEHILVQNASARLAARAADPPCALLVVGNAVDGTVEWQGRTFVERWRSTPVRVYATQP